MIDYPEAVVIDVQRNNSNDMTDTDREVKLLLVLLV